MTYQSLEKACELLKTESEVKAEIAYKIRIDKEIAKTLKDLMENPKK